MQIRSFSAYTRPLSSEYQSDADFSLKGQLNTNQQGINVFTHDATNNARDVSINNYSALVLSDNIQTANAFTLNTLSESNKRIISSYLAISYTNELNANTKYLYFDNERETTSADFASYTSHQMLHLADIVNESQRYFNIELIDSQYARINFSYNSADYYLAANTSNELLFVSGDQYLTFDKLILNFIDETIFSYIYDIHTDTIFFLKPQPAADTRALGVSTQDSTILQLLSCANTNNYFAFNSFNFKIRPSAANILQKLNTSWAAYNIGNLNSLDVNSDKTIQDLSNNILIASQYNTATQNSVLTRPIILKNQHTLQSTTDKSSYVNLINGECGVQSREYSAIFSGNDQETGNDKISLNYVIYGNDYKAQPDAYSNFKTPKDLYPYAQLNVNDTSLTINGAFGGDSPYTSDQIFMQKNAAQGADGQYLCTWLSGGTWVDRYYNTDAVTLLDAAKAVNSTYGVYSSFAQQFSSFDIFDKVSDFVFEPGQDYFYYRIGNKRIKEHFNNYSDSLMLSALAWKNAKTLSTDIKYVCNGVSYGQITDYGAINNSSQFTLAFWIDSNDWQNIKGHNLVGNITNQGIGVIADPVITPFVMVQISSAIHVLNSDLVEISTTTLSAAKFLLRNDALDNYQAITSQGNLYKIDSNGSIYDEKILNVSSIAATNANKVVYLLNNDQSTVTAFDTVTEQVSSLQVTPNSQCICIIDGELFGFLGTKVSPYTPTSVLYLINQNQIIYNDFTTGDEYVAFKTLSAGNSVNFIQDFVVDVNQNCYVVHGDLKISKFDSERNHQFTVSLLNTLSATDLTGVAVDVCYEYIADAKQTSIIVAAIDSDSIITLIKLNESGQLLTSQQTTLQYVPGTVLNLTNSCWLVSQYKNRPKALDFIVSLRNHFNNLDATDVRYSLDISKFTSSKHHFAIRVDGIQGNVTIFVDGRVQYNQYIGAAKFAQLPLLNSGICFGATQSSNGVLLATHLSQPYHYFVSGVALYSPYLYDTALSDNDIKLIIMQEKPIESLVFHLPCGQRNNLDTIRHMFAWGTPGFKSNNIKVTLKGINTLTDSFKSALKTQITQEVAAVLPVNTNILDVEFVDFN